MKTFFLTLSTLVSLILFPWPFAAALALAASISVPLIPVTAGLFADTLYYVPTTEMLPLFTLYGALATGIAFFVRNRLNPGTIEE